MKTIGTITFHDSINYGAILQAYGLQRRLKEMGHENEIIDYKNPQRSVATLSGFRRWGNTIWVSAVKPLLVGTGRLNKTDDFCKKNLQFSARQYVSPESLHTSPPLYDAYITGSDQVWNPRNNNRDSSYFLTFAPPGKKRISYAASFGVAQIPEEFGQECARWLAEIHACSVRELEGRHIVARLTGRDCDVVVDPTFLLERKEWEKIAAPYESSKQYILAYFMPGDKRVNLSIAELARQISSLTGWDVVAIGQKEYMSLKFWKRAVFDAGPAEFLGLFQNASFVVTNSFHGSAFSIINEKPFFVPVNRDLPPSKSLHSRITNLLKTLGLEHRILPAGAGLPNGDFLDLDYLPVMKALQQEKQRSIEFLKKALESSAT